MKISHNNFNLYIKTVLSQLVAMYITTLKNNLLKWTGENFAYLKIGTSNYSVPLH